MKRRDFLVGLGGMAAVPLVTRAQQQRPVIGYLSSLGSDERPNLRGGFRRGLSEAGLAEGRNISVEYRYASNQYDRLSMLAAELVERRVAAIVATGGGNSIVAAKLATSTIPVVFTYGGDPVRAGYVASLNKPGGNVTGVSFFNTVLGGKVLELLHGVVPAPAIIALMINPKNQESESSLGGAQSAARAFGRELLIVRASSAAEIDTAFAALRQWGARGLFIGGDPFMTTRRQQIVALAARDGIPVVYANRDFVDEGGLISYGNDVADAYRRAALYVGRILKGDKPADLPVDQATRFELVINLKTAKELQLEIPPTLLARADEVIE